MTNFILRAILSPCYIDSPDPEFARLLEYRFRREQELGVISDIFDGEEYEKHSEFFESRYNVSFALNFDGAPKFRSSSVQVWPVMLYVNELPPHIRYLLLTIFRC